MSNTISGYRFSPADLDVPGRKPGISAFMRIRNGADFLEATIRSHVDFFDEIVAVYNQCTDATPEILERLGDEFGSKLKVWHYEDRVFPPGSEGHAATDPNSPSSMVNYSNFALSRTAHRVVTKLDDDHLAIPGELQRIVSQVRAAPEDCNVMHSFSGINLIRSRDGRLGIPKLSPLSGSGDIGFFPVRPNTAFTHDRRFERVPRKGLKRKFAGFAYWHLKFLKQGLGFANYELDQNPNSRFAARQSAFSSEDMQTYSLEELVDRSEPRLAQRLAGIISTKQRLLADRGAALARTFQGMTLEQALKKMSDPAARAMIFTESDLSDDPETQS